MSKSSRDVSLEHDVSSTRATSIQELFAPANHALTLPCLMLVEDENLDLLLAKAMMHQQNHTGC